MGATDVYEQVREIVTRYEENEPAAVEWAKAHPVEFRKMVLLILKRERDTWRLERE